jgi:hypothetical protein
LRRRPQRQAIDDDDLLVARAGGAASGGAVSFVPAWRPWWILAMAAALLGWWLAPLPGPAPALVKPRQDSWRLAPLPRRVDQTTAAALVSGAAYWGAAAVPPDAVAKAAEDPRWRIAAVYGVGQDRGALVQFAAAGKLPLRVHVGEKLPSGHRVLSIGERDVCVEIGGKAYRLGVERSGS